jgi:uncharacterized protein (UPF0332 family)
LKIAELAYGIDCYNASANRAYYSAFHAEIAAIYSLGITPIEYLYKTNILAFPKIELI